MLYEYLQSNYSPNEPILASELQIEGINKNNLLQQLKRLTDAGKICRYGKGIYYLPAQSVFKSGTAPSAMKIIERKYLGSGQGYITGVAFANQIGATTQMPMVYEIATNKATSSYKKLMLGGNRIVLRKPRAKVTLENCLALQLLDLLKDVDLLAESPKEELRERLLAYMRKKGLTFKALQPFLPLYPDKIYKNLYETGLLSGY